MKAQEIFNTAAEHLFTQNQPAINGDGDCRYRLLVGDSMLKCGVGIFLPDERYDPFLEGNSSDSLIEDGVLPKKFNRHKELLSDIQHVHDYAARMEDGTFNKKLLQEDLDNLAKRKRLQRYIGYVDNETME